jgi:hypothetical protein
MNFIVFLLGFILGNESVKWAYGGGNQDNILIALLVLEFVARDDFILTYIKEKSDQLGCSCALTKSTSKRYTKWYLNRLKINRSEQLITLLRQGF